MPTITNTPVRAYAHCVNSHCRGNAQAEVDALVEETTWLYTENGGNLAMPERSSVNLRFVNSEERHCPECGKNRDLSASKRTSFDGTISGFDPRGLLEMQAAGVEFDPARQHELRQEPLADPERERMVALEAENTEMRERMARLEGFMLGQHEQQVD